MHPIRTCYRMSPEKYLWWDPFKTCPGASAYIFVEYFNSGKSTCQHADISNLLNLGMNKSTYSIISVVITWSFTEPYFSKNSIHILRWYVIFILMITVQRPNNFTCSGAENHCASSHEGDISEYTVVGYKAQKCRCSHIQSKAHLCYFCFKQYSIENPTIPLPVLYVNFLRLQGQYWVAWMKRCPL